MKAVLSVTADPLYSFLLPFAVHSWNLLGVDCLIFYPVIQNPRKERVKRMDLVFDYCKDGAMVYPILVESEDREPTYAQVSRLYGAAIKAVDDKEILITSDSDMAVFGNTLLMGDIDKINIYGHDLVDQGQFPICYIAMQKMMWRKIMAFDAQAYYGDLLRWRLEPLYCEHMRGNYWALDQETIFNKIKESGEPIHGHCRANVPTKFATRRADRDSWPDIISPDIIDAHLPRPGHTDDNFKRITNLFETMYPGHDNEWMYDYRAAFLKTI